MLGKSFKVSALILSLAIGLSLFSGCGKSSDKSAETTSSPAQKEEQTASAASYPIKTDKKLTVYGHAAITGIVKDFNETPFAKGLENKTGVKVEFLPANDDKLRLMVAGGDLPDILTIDALRWPGGPEKLLSQNVIIKLNDLIDKNAPNLKKYLGGNPEVKKMVATDNGSMYCFPYLRGDDILSVYMGPMVRKDWLDDLGLSAPTTMDEWYTVLKAFKEKKGATAPLTFEKGFIGPEWMGGDLGAPASAFIGAFGIQFTYYQENGKVKAGFIEPAYKDFLQTFNKWYKEGLIDQNFASSDNKAVTFNITTGKSGAAVGHTGSRMGAWLPAGKAQDPKYDLLGVPYPVLNKGDKPKFGQRDPLYVSQLSNSISGKCSDPELAAKWLDYGYSKEGIIYNNFGTEGVSYTMVNGEPKYTDIIMKNPDGLNLSQALTKYIRGNTGGPFIQDKGYILQYLSYDQQKAAVKLWADTDESKYLMPPIAPTADESQEISKVIGQIRTYSNEMFYKFIIGAENIDNYDKYVTELKKLGVDKVTEIYQKALDRYNKR